MKPYLLRFHRWLTLLFSIPLAVLIVTGLMLSVEPIMQDVSTKPGSLTAEKLSALLKQHDPEGKTRAIMVRPYEDRLTFQRTDDVDDVDLALSTGQEVDDEARTLPSQVFRFARGLHEHFIFDLEWVVTAATIGMVALIALGVLMGWPRIRNTMSGWHQGMAWFALPLTILSPLTGLAIAWNITFTTPQPQDRAALPKIAQAVELLGKEHDLSGLIWLRQRGPRLLARINEGGTFRVYAVSIAGVKPTPTNWPRALHEGNFAGLWSGLMVLVTSLAMMGLMVTGLTIYLRRLLRPRQRNRQRPAAQPAE